MRRLLAATVSVAALAACTSTSNLPQAPLFPQPVKAVTLPPYTIQVGDVLDVRLMLNPELNEEVTVRPDGHISTTVVPDELAAGRSVGELTTALRQDYRHDLSNPRLTVLVKSYAPSRIYVGGEVNSPGEFVTVGPGLSLTQAIARAGGVKLSGDDANVFIIRRPVQGAQPELYAVRYSDAIHARDASADITLAPYDMVYIPKTGIAEVYAFYNQYLGQFVNPSFGMTYLLNNTGSTSVVPTGTATPVTTTGGGSTTR